jgi:gas vesicle protein GvpG
MFILDSLLMGGLRFVLDQIVAAAEADMQDDSALREQLLEAQMRLELGEISEDEFRAVENDVLQRIREIKSRRPGGGSVVISPEDRISGVEIETFDSNR